MLQTVYSVIFRQNDQMKQLLQEYSAYNLWANQTITDLLVQLDESLHQQFVNSSFPNLYGTILHIWDAESGWWQRVQHHEKIMYPSSAFNPSMKEAVNGLLQQSADWMNWLKQQEDLQLVYDYQNKKKENFSQPLWEILLHVFNHSTYHRGQLITMLRELGQTNLPATDFIQWSRNKAAE
jgi:uncharacterized damage-inducible protein DinB